MLKQATPIVLKALSSVGYQYIVVLAFCCGRRNTTISRHPGRYRNFDGTLTTHTDRKIDKLTGIIMDDEGNILLGSDIGAGLLDDRDLYLFSEMVNIDISTATHLKWNKEVLPVKRVPRSKIPIHCNFSQCIAKP